MQRIRVSTRRTFEEPLLLRRVDHDTVLQNALFFVLYARSRDVLCRRTAGQ